MNATSQRQSSLLKRRVMTVLKALIIVAVIAGIARAVNKGWAQLLEFDFAVTYRTAGWIAFAGFVYVAALLPFGIYWLRVLRAMDQRPPFWAVMRAYFLGHLGKYVPGKAMVVVLRTGGLQQANSAVTAISVFAETLAMMAVGAFVAAGIIATQFADKTAFLLAAVVLMIMAGVPTFPPVFRFIVLTLKVDKVDEAVRRSLDKYTWNLVISGWALSLIGWLMMAFSLYAVLQAFPVASSAQSSLFAAYPRMLAAVSLAVVAGFLSLLPGGVGVRELVFNELLNQPYGSVVAMICPVLVRLTWLFSELLVAGVLQLFVRQSKTPDLNQTHDA